VQIDKQFVIDEIKKQGQSARVQHALDELPEKVDHEQHAALLEKFGIDPGKLAEKAAKQGLARL
jgi:predicted metal-dependent phosphoesterase TrpH